MLVKNKETGEVLLRACIKDAKGFYGQGTCSLPGVIEENEDGTVTVIEPDQVVELELVYEASRVEDLQYLADTDWYVTRELETGKAVPVEVKAKRSKIRVRL